MYGTLMTQIQWMTADKYQHKSVASASSAFYSPGQPLKFFNSQLLWPFPKQLN